MRPTGAVQKYAGSDRDPAAIGRELSVDAVLDGRIQKTADQLRVTVQLVRVADGTTIWSGQFDERLTNILAVQDLISDQAVQAMKLKLTPVEGERLAKHPSTNSEAYQAYLKGRFFWNKRTLEGFKKGIEYFQQAIDLDPHYAPAYSGLADCYNLSSEYSGLDPKEAFTTTKEAARRALELDESLAEAHASLAYIQVNYEWDWAGAEREFKRAIELNPDYATAHQWYAEHLLHMGRLDEGQTELARALEIDPLSLIINAEQGLPFTYRGQPERAIEQYQKALDLDPNFPLTHALLRYAYESSGRDREAFTEALTFFTLIGLSPAAIAAIKEGYACCGMRGVYEHELAYNKARRQLTYVPPYVIALICAKVGEKQQALNWLERAYKERDRFLISVAQEPSFDSLRSDPRFTDLLRRMGLPS